MLNPRRTCNNGLWYDATQPKISFCFISKIFISLESDDRYGSSDQFSVELLQTFPWLSLDLTHQLRFIMASWSPARLCSIDNDARRMCFNEITLLGSSMSCVFLFPGEAYLQNLSSMVIVETMNGAWSLQGMEPFTSPPTSPYFGVWLFCSASSACADTKDIPLQWFVLMTLTYEVVTPD